MIDDNLFEVVDRRGQKHLFKRSEGFSFAFRPEQGSIDADGHRYLDVFHTEPDGDYMTASTFIDPVGVGYFPKQEDPPYLGPLSLKNIFEYDRMKSALEKISSIVDHCYRSGRTPTHREIKELCLDGLFGKEEPSA